MNDDSTQDLPSSDMPSDVIALIQGMSKQLSALQMTVDERLYDTRPLWESVQGQINDLRFDVEQGFREMRAESKADVDKLRTELTRELRHVSNTLDAVLGQLARLDVIQRDIESRMRDIESKSL